MWQGSTHDPYGTSGTLEMVWSAVHDPRGSIQIFCPAAPEAGWAAMVGPASRAAHHTSRGISAWRLSRNHFVLDLAVSCLPRSPVVHLAMVHGCRTDPD